MNIKKGKMIGFIVFLIAIIAIQIMFYNRNMNLVSTRPSAKWSRQLKISHGETSNMLDILELDNFVVVAHKDKENIKLLQLALDGKIMNEKNISIGKKPNSLSLIRSNSGFMMAWSSFENSSRKIHTQFYDESLSLLEEKNFDGFEKGVKLSESKLLIYNDKNFKFLSDDFVSEDFSTEDIGRIVTAKTSDGIDYIISVHNSNNRFNCNIFKDNSYVSSSTISNRQLLSSSNSTSESVVVIDSDVYFMYDVLKKGAYKKTELIKFNLESEESELISLDSLSYRIKNYFFTDDNSVIASAYDLKDNRERVDNIVEINVNDLNSTNRMFVSNTPTNSLYSKKSGNYLVFGDYVTVSEQDIYITSSNDSLTLDTSYLNDVSRDFAVGLTIKDFGFTFCNMWIVGAFWVTGMLIMFAIFFIADHKLNGKFRTLAFIALSIVTLYFEILNMKVQFFNKFGNAFPPFLTFNLAIFLAVALYMIVAIFSYKPYIEQKESVPLGTFMILMMLQIFTIISLFSPYTLQV